MRKIILASHGKLSEGLLNSANMIVGDLTKCVTTYSLYPGEIATDFVEKLEKEIIVDEKTEYVIIADLYGASVSSALYRITQYKNVKLFTGMSFNMLLELLTNYEQLLTDKDVEQLLNEARSGIRLISIDEQTVEEEEF